MASLGEPLVTSGKVDEGRRKEDNNDDSYDTDGSDCTEKKSNTAKPRPRRKSKKAKYQYRTEDGAMIKPIVWWMDVARARKEKAKEASSGGEVTEETAMEKTFLRFVQDHNISVEKQRRLFQLFQDQDDDGQQFVLNRFQDCFSCIDRVKVALGPIRVAVASLMKLYLSGLAVQCLVGELIFGGEESEDIDEGMAQRERSLHAWLNANPLSEKKLCEECLALHLELNDTEREAANTCEKVVIEEAHRMTRELATDNCLPSSMSLVWQTLSSICSELQVDSRSPESCLDGLKSFAKERAESLHSHSSASDEERLTVYLEYSCCWLYYMEGFVETFTFLKRAFAVHTFCKWTVSMQLLVLDTLRLFGLILQGESKLGDLPNRIIGFAYKVKSSPVRHTFVETSFVTGLEIFATGTSRAIRPGLRAIGNVVWKRLVWRWMNEVWGSNGNSRNCVMDVLNIIGDVWDAHGSTTTAAAPSQGRERGTQVTQYSRICHCVPTGASR